MDLSVFAKKISKAPIVKLLSEFTEILDKSKCPDVSVGKYKRCHICAFFTHIIIVILRVETTVMQRVQEVLCSLTDKKR